MFLIMILLLPFRNGWIKNVSIAILRHKSHEKCANNMTGLIINSHKTADELFDVYCYDEEGIYIMLHFFCASKFLFADYHMKLQLVLHKSYNLLLHFGYVLFLVLDLPAGSDKNCTKRFQSNANFNSPAPGLYNTPIHFHTQ